ncbi:DUF4269 domain-containing protein [Bacteroidales bacterium OttesenSCG-928-M11]|nr:DUF4269 domain-containing protein [Bacteroidales bacterium OttesenSCG-928-M11]
MDFTTIDYLKDGNPRQKSAYQALQRRKIFDILKPFDPLLVGTIPIAIDIESSDLDIICCYTDLDYFIRIVTENFKQELNFNHKLSLQNGKKIALFRFQLDGFEVELYAQDTPTLQQNAYRHMLIEARLLNEHGENFRQEIIRLKQKGYKTEPAFAHLLGITGDPYEVLLRME